MASESLTARTDAKLRYATLHIKELRDCQLPGQGHDFERAHLEAFFAQLFGAYSALFHELNEDLGCGLKPESVSLGKLRSAMKDTRPVSPKLTGLFDLEKDTTSWLAQAKRMRDHVMHTAGIPLVFYEGGPNHRVTAFRDPQSLIELPGDYRDYLELWGRKMEALVVTMRN
jgi:hypothetical protein